LLSLCRFCAAKKIIVAFNATERAFEMAFVERDVMKITYTLRDQQRASFASFYIGKVSGAFPDISNPAFRNFLGEFGDNLAAVSDCYVEGYSISFTWENDVDPIVYGPTADVERKAVLQFKVADGFSTIFTIPGAKYAMFGADGETIVRPDNSGSFDGNALEAPLESIHDKLRNGVTIGLVTYPVTDRRASDFRGLLDAYKQHRSNPRG
jgi:hypothetical protein